jgi:hypothetical protein
MWRKKSTLECPSEAALRIRDVSAKKFFLGIIFIIIVCRMLEVYFLISNAQRRHKTDIKIIRIPCYPGRTLACELLFCPSIS